MVTFPSYIPPINIENMLSFSSMSDYFKFIEAANLMEDLWKNSDVDYEDTPSEIYHLGDESYNAIDSAMNFKSLRSVYELNDFYDDTWRDTTTVYVEDDDKQIVLNEFKEVSIAGKYYKYVLENIFAKIDDLTTLETVQIWGPLTRRKYNIIF